MKPSNASPDPLARPVLLIGFWLLFSLIVVAHTVLVLQVRGVPLEPSIFLASALHGLSWIGLTPLVTRLARRFPLDHPRYARHLWVHLGAMLLLNVLVVAAIVVIAGLLDREAHTFWQLFIGTFLSSFFFFLLLYAAVVAAVYAVDYARRARERAIHASHLEAQLAQAQLEALRMQLNPHFLFNTLHAVSALMSRNVGAARSMLAELSDLLRLSLDRVDENETPLDDELAFLRHYLRIEQIRFRDRLTIEEHIAPDTTMAMVPALLLQPLVENAIKHGVAPRGQGGHVIISSRRDGEELVLTVADDGPGIKEDRQGTEGVGLRNTRARLSKLYGDLGHLTLHNLTQGGFLAEVRLPFHTNPYSAILCPPSA